MQKWNISADRAQRVNEKNEVIRLVMFTPRDMVIKCQKWLILYNFCWIPQKLVRFWEEIFKCIWKVVFSPFRKNYGLCSSELPLAKFQHLKIQGFRIPLLTQQFFKYLSTISHKQLSPKPINHTIFYKNSIRPFHVYKRCSMQKIY